MSKKPIINGLAAFLYIIIIAWVMNLGTQMVKKPHLFIGPIAVISLFTLSAAVMGYLFCYQPIQLYFEEKKKQAVDLFLQTTIVFACFTAIILVLLFSGIFS